MIKFLKIQQPKLLKKKKIKPAGQPKIDLKTFGEGKDLEYTISVTELPNIDTKPLSNIKFNEINFQLFHTKSHNNKINLNM